ncbi:MAG: hypothetical protein HC873_15790 [Leptolyngbyaceae cyanobacterium SL_1_1]|nr:hypothetical protein [Leptolyngbyaceae cyanobacterium RM1_1_2]NJO10858.1 hypothetical protein [Leptolyngbyaceae cyanobacterium SL_1_1]
MTTAPAQALTLTDFLSLPKVAQSPAWEYIDGQVSQKPMPKGRHSKLQFNLCQSINLSGAAHKTVYAQARTSYF